PEGEGAVVVEQEPRGAPVVRVVDQCGDDAGILVLVDEPPVVEHAGFVAFAFDPGVAGGAEREQVRELVFVGEHGSAHAAWFAVVGFGGFLVSAFLADASAAFHEHAAGDGGELGGFHGGCVPSWLVAGSPKHTCWLLYQSVIKGERLPVHRLRVLRRPPALPEPRMEQHHHPPTAEERRLLSPVLELRLHPRNQVPPHLTGERFHSTL